MSQVQHEGGCSCGSTRYRLTETALIVHACHCKMCQVLTGSSHAVNVLIEAANVHLLSGETLEVVAHTPSGHGQVITRCKTCFVAVWSVYQHFEHRTGCPVRFVRAGTLDHPQAFPPDVHIYTETRLPHAPQSDATPEFTGFYRLRDIWSAPKLQRLSHYKNTPTTQQE